MRHTSLGPGPPSPARFGPPFSMGQSQRQVIVKSRERREIQFTLGRPTKTSGAKRQSALGGPRNTGWDEGVAQSHRSNKLIPSSKDREALF